MPESLVDKVVGDYKVLRELGRGGMGVVYLAYDQRLQRHVAFKTLTGGMDVAGNSVRRFLHEARAAARLDHPNIATVYAAGEHNGLCYIAMQYVKGQSLRDIIQERGRLSEAESLCVARAVCEALAEAHSQGIIHRDIKPSNVMVDEQGRVLLVDFGLARLSHAATSMTGEGALVGTPLYMSPEQVRSHPIDARTDIYSLGAVLFEMLAGEPAYRADNLLAVFHRILQEPVPDLCALNAGVRPGVGRIVARLMAKEPGMRYVSAEDVCGALDELMSNREAPVPSWDAPLDSSGSISLESDLVADLLSANPNTPGAGAPYRRATMRDAVTDLVRRWGLRVAIGGLVLLVGILAVRAVARGVQRSGWTLSNVLKTVAGDEGEERDAAPARGGRAAEERRPGLMETFGGFEMVWIPAGEFTMGHYDGNGAAGLNDEFPPHQVTLSKGFWLGKYEVTQEEWWRVMGGVPSTFKGDRLPVESVTWDDCQYFLKVLNEEAVGCPRFRLPTEAEWEYACRAGSKQQFSFGENLRDELYYFGWYAENNGESTAEVGRLKPNAWNLYDMHGNVWEWCEDLYDKGYYARSPSNDPKGPERTPAMGEPTRVIRGGSWRDLAWDCRSGAREGFPPGDLDSSVGFRLAMDPE